MDAPEDAPILFHNTMRIKDGHLAGFREAIRQAVEFVEEHGPQLMVEVFIDEDRLLAHSFQLYRDSESILAHWRLSDPYIREVMEHCTVERFEIYGRPSAAVREGFPAAGGEEFPFTITPRFTGFTRFLSGE
ncbi:hypothetical protein [Amycolatopsis nigrescens]|uniref:hypothetical protein n=1 Tax=Amycolatopsis nigrescens TaxID=381445 RepID=UPI0003818ED9|nr:hypothetical protein [Amycolatopsis nigrescens]